jgi:predicted nucleic-acid-binding Zn-ribbon protein
MRESKECPECGRSNLYRTEASAGGGYAPNYLPSLGSFFVGAKFVLVLCQDCGLTRFFADRAALPKVSTSKKWKRYP